MSKYPNNITVAGTIYDLKHLHPQSVEIVTPKNDKQPELTIEMKFRFSNHCYSEGVEKKDPDPEPLY